MDEVFPVHRKAIRDICAGLGIAEKEKSNRTAEEARVLCARTVNFFRHITSK